MIFLVNMYVIGTTGKTRPVFLKLGNFKIWGLQLPEFLNQPFWWLKSTNLKVANIEKH